MSGNIEEGPNPAAEVLHRPPMEEQLDPAVGQTARQLDQEAREVLRSLVGRFNEEMLAERRLQDSADDPPAYPFMSRSLRRRRQVIRVAGRTHSAAQEAQEESF